MIHNLIYLNDEFPMLNSGASLTSYCIYNHNEYPYDRKRKTILVLPGGGYAFCSEREKEPIALKFIAKDFNVFVLDYSVGEGLHFPYPMVEAFAAIVYIRRHAEEYNVDVDHIGVMGFSAGGHLAGMLSIYKEDEFYANFLNVSTDELRIDFTILCYAVNIASEDDFIKKYLIKEEKNVQYFDISNHITSNFPPTFIWTTKSDEVVPYTNSTRLIDSLKEAGVKYEFHLFPTGKHGGSTCDLLTNTIDEVKELGDAYKWIDLCSDFINNL